jgi:hypothetical protein
MLEGVTIIPQTDPMRRLVSSSAPAANTLGSAIPLERFSVSVLAKEHPDKAAMLATMTTHLTDEFHAAYPEIFGRLDLISDGGTRTNTATSTATAAMRPRRLHARQASEAFDFSFHGTVTFRADAAQVPLQVDIATIQAVALSNVHVIQVAIQANPNMADNVMVASVQMITSPRPPALTMQHGTSTTPADDGPVAKESL